MAQLLLVRDEPPKPGSCRASFFFFFFLIELPHVKGVQLPQGQSKCHTGSQTFNAAVVTRTDWLDMTVLSLRGGLITPALVPYASEQRRTWHICWPMAACGADCQHVSNTIWIFHSPDEELDGARGRPSDWMRGPHWQWAPASSVFFSASAAHAKGVVVD